MSSAHTCCKLLKKFKNTNKLSTIVKQQVCIFPEGASPLYAGVTPGSISKPQGG